MQTVRISLLTGGSDKPYVLGLAPALTAQGCLIDLIGSDELICEELTQNTDVHFLNLRGSTGEEATRWAKVVRITKYYSNLMVYATRRQPKIFHILWANRFFLLDRVIINFYYKLMGKKLAFTAHNVNQCKRDGDDTLYNRLTLKIMYALIDHIFVHTENMQAQLTEEFGVDSSKISVIPFGINNTLPNTAMSPERARSILGLDATEKVILFFGRISRYKGLEYAISALDILRSQGTIVRLVVAGKIEDDNEAYWQEIESSIAALHLENQVIRKIGFIPDEDVELYFKSADVLLLPYRAIFQSGVLFLAYSFGLPVIASKVGSFGNDIIEGRSGEIFQAGDIEDLANTCQRYFDSDLYRDLPQSRLEIMAFGNKKYSWDEVGEITRATYNKLLTGRCIESHCENRPIL